MREEHGKEMDVRTHKNDYKRKKEGYSSIKINPQDSVDSKKM